jgi:hypothetical protein
MFKKEENRSKSDGLRQKDSPHVCEEHFFSILFIDQDMVNSPNVSGSRKKK